MIFAACYLSVKTFNSYKEIPGFWLDCTPVPTETTGNLVALHFYLA